MQNNVLDYLYQIVEKKPDKIAYSDGTVSLSFREVHQISRSIGSFLHKKGIYRKPVVVFMRKSPMEVAAFSVWSQGEISMYPLTRKCRRVGFN